MRVLQSIITVVNVLVLSVRMNYGEISMEFQNDSEIYWVDSSTQNGSQSFDLISSENGSNATGESSLNESSESWFDELNTENLKHSMTYTAIMTGVYLFVFFVGIVGNSVVILVIGLKSHIRTVTNLFIFNLAVADMFVLLFCLPVTLIASLFKPWMLGNTMCWGVAYVQGVSVVASAYSLAAISVDRCKLICQRTMSTHGFSQGQVVLVLCAIWTLAVLIPLPWVFVFELQVSQADRYNICSENWSSDFADMFYFIFGNLFCCYILPFILILSANVKIWLRVSRHKIPQTNKDSTFPSVEALHSTSTSRRKGRNVGKMLGIVTFAFLICWLPLYILATRVKIAVIAGDVGDNILWAFLPLAQWLAYANSCVNPLLYAFFNSNIHKGNKCEWPRFLMSKCCLKSESAPVIETPKNLDIIVDEPSRHVDKTGIVLSPNEIMSESIKMDTQQLSSASLNKAECTSDYVHASTSYMKCCESNSTKVTTV